MRIQSILLIQSICMAYAIAVSLLPCTMVSCLSDVYFFFVAVKCPDLVDGVDYINSRMQWVDTNGDGSFSFSDGITFACLVGYEYASGDVNRQCTANQTWSGDVYQCTRKLQNTMYLHRDRRLDIKFKNFYKTWSLIMKLIYWKMNLQKGPYFSWRHSKARFFI